MCPGRCAERRAGIGLHPRDGGRDRRKAKGALEKEPSSAPQVPQDVQVQPALIPSLEAFGWSVDNQGRQNKDVKRKP